MGLLVVFLDLVQHLSHLLAHKHGLEGVDETLPGELVVEVLVNSVELVTLLFLTTGSCDDNSLW